MEQPKKKTEWDKTDTIEKWKGLNTNDKKLYITDIKAILKKPGTAEHLNLLAWLGKPAHKEIKKAVSAEGKAKNQGDGGDASGKDPREAKAKAQLDAILTTIMGWTGEHDAFKDDQWKKKLHKLPRLHRALRDMSVHKDYGAFVKGWLKNNARRSLRLFVLNCEPIEYANLKGILESDDPNRVGNLQSLDGDDMSWLENLRDAYGVEKLDGSGLLGGKRSKVEHIDE